MADFFVRVRETVGRPLTALGSAQVLRRAGLVRPGRPDEMVQSMASVRRYGPLAGAMRIAARRDPGTIGLVDEIGPLTFRQLDHRSNALARTWQWYGVTSADVVGLLCRNHRGFLDTMFACAKLGASVVLLNIGFGGRQLADVAQREGISVIVYDQEFTAVVADLPPAITRFLAWVDMPAPAEAPTLERLIAETDDADLMPPRTVGRMVLLTSGTTGTPKGAPRQIRSPLVAAEFLDRIPYRANEATMISAPLFHATGVSQVVVTLALGSVTVLARRFDPGTVLSRIEQHRCTGLVLVPTMLQRILALGPYVISRFDTSSLRIILCAGSALSPELGNRTLQTFVDGRADDMIVTGGENVYPGEVENLLVEHPDVYDAAVVGVPDPEYGQRLRAYVVPAPRARVTPEELQAFVRRHLARYKVPRDVAYVADLPRNPTGKLLRHLLR